MQKTKWITALIALLFLASCFFPWILIETKNIVVSGVDAEGTRWGKPGYFSLLFISIYFIFNFIPTNWAHRSALVFAALNFGWSLRNFFLLSMCQGGECPQRQPFFYVYIISAGLLLLLVLLRRVNPEKEENESTPLGE